MFVSAISARGHYKVCKTEGWNKQHTSTMTASKLPFCHLGCMDPFIFRQKERVMNWFGDYPLASLVTRQLLVAISWKGCSAGDLQG